MQGRGRTYPRSPCNNFPWGNYNNNNNDDNNSYASSSSSGANINANKTNAKKESEKYLFLQYTVNMYITNATLKL